MTLDTHPPGSDFSEIRPSPTDKDFKYEMVNSTNKEH